MTSPDWWDRALCRDLDPEIRKRHGLDLADIADERFIARFWSKVEKGDGCWTWTAHRKASGYGQFTLKKGVFVGAHTVAFALTNGPIPAGMSICHHCDNPPCVRPDHLFMGTQSDNTLDMVAKGRAIRTRGEERHNAVLSEADVQAIRSEPHRYGIYSQLGRRFGVSHNTIRKIRLGEGWRHVGG